MFRESKHSAPKNLFEKRSALNRNFQEKISIRLKLFKKSKLVERKKNRNWTKITEVHNDKIRKNREIKVKNSKKSQNSKEKNQKRKK